MLRRQGFLVILLSIGWTVSVIISAFFPELLVSDSIVRSANDQHAANEDSNELDGKPSNQRTACKICLTKEMKTRSFRHIDIRSDMFGTMILVQEPEHHAFQMLAPRPSHLDKRRVERFLNIFLDTEITPVHGDSMLALERRLQHMNISPNVTMRLEDISAVHHVIRFYSFDLTTWYAQYENQWYEMPSLSGGHFPPSPKSLTDFNQPKLESVY